MYFVKWICLLAAVAFAAAEEMGARSELNVPQQQQQSNIPSGQNVQQQQSRDVSAQCLRCLCEGSTNNCDRNAGCDNQGFCGPFRLSRHYWEEAGSFGNDFERCAKEYSCAERTVKAYMEKFGTDCDGDGNTDCKDFALIHHKGRHGCPYPDFASDSLYKYVTDCMQKKKPDFHHEEKGGLLSSMMPNIGQSHDQQQQGVNVDQQQQQQHRGPIDFIKDKAHGAKESIQSGMESIKPDQQKTHGAKDKLQSGMESIKPDQHRHDEHLHDKQQQFPSVGSQEDRHLGQQQPSSQLNPEQQQKLQQQPRKDHKEDRKDVKQEQERFRESPLGRQRRHLFA